MIVVIDASVLTDIFLVSRSRHARADKLVTLLKQTKTRIRLPMHALFELASAMKQEKIVSRRKLLQFNTALSEDKGLAIDPVAIDENFFEKYFSVDLPYLRSGDLIYVAMAKGDGVALITEDSKQYDGAKQAGVVAYRIDKAIEELICPAIPLRPALEQGKWLSMVWTNAPPH